VVVLLAISVVPAAQIMLEHAARSAQPDTSPKLPVTAQAVFGDPLCVDSHATCPMPGTRTP
jgi:hypothetical protein